MIKIMETYVVTTPKRKVRITIDERETEIEIYVVYSRCGLLGDEPALEKLLDDALGRFKDDGRWIIYRNRRIVRVGKRRPDGTWVWMDGDDPGGPSGDSGGGGSPDKPVHPGSPGLGLQTPRRAVQVDTQATDQKEEVNA